MKMRLTKDQIEQWRIGRAAPSGPDLLDTIDALESELTTARAETAAMLEKAANICDYPGAPISVPAWRDSIRALILTSHAAALEKIVSERVLAESEVWNNNAGVKRLDDESEWAKMRLAANRAAAGAGDQNR